MRSALLACVAAVVQRAGAFSNAPPIRNFPEEHSLETRTAMSSEAFPAPKAPPPTEVTRAFATRDAEGPTAVVSPAALQQQLSAKQASALWEEKRAVLLENAMLDHPQRRSTSITSEKAVKFLATSLFAVALTGLSLFVLSEVRGRLPSVDSLLPPSLQREDVPSALAELVTAHRVVVFLSDDCQVCMAGLKDLETEQEKPVSVLLMGHRLDRPVRGYLEARYGIVRLPAIFVEGEPFIDFESAVVRLAKRREGPSRSRSETDSRTQAD